MAARAQTGAPPTIASAMRRPVSGPTIAVTAIQAIAAMSPSSSADCTKLSRCGWRRPRSSRLVASEFAPVLIAHQPVDSAERKHRARECGNLG